MDPRTSECKAAYEEWAAKEMPWVLEKPDDDMEKLVRTTALISFERGYQAGAAHSRSK